MIQQLLEARAKNVKKFVGFLEYGRAWYFAYEIYWPLLVMSKPWGRLHQTFVASSEKLNIKIWAVKKNLKMYILSSVYVCLYFLKSNILWSFHTINLQGLGQLEIAAICKKLTNELLTTYMFLQKLKKDFEMVTVTNKDERSVG